MADPARLARAAITNTRGWFSDSLSIDHERVDLLEAALAVCDDADRPTRTRLMSRLATEAVTDPTRRLEAVDMSVEAVTIASGRGRSEERRGGKEGVRNCRARWSTYH